MHFKLENSITASSVMSGNFEDVFIIENLINQMFKVSAALIGPFDLHRKSSKFSGNTTGPNRK